jgi:hypothetical protein
LDSALNESTTAPFRLLLTYMGLRLHGVGHNVDILCDEVGALDCMADTSHKPTLSVVKAKFKFALESCQGVMSLTFVHVLNHTGLECNELSDIHSKPTLMA